MAKPKPTVIDQALPELAKLPMAVSPSMDFNGGKMAINPGGGQAVFWRGKGPEVDDMRRVWAEEFLRLLNLEAWLDGFWVVMWVDYDLKTATYKRAVWAYLDKGNDLQFVCDSEQPIEELVEETFDKINGAIAAYHQWRETMRAMDIRAKDQISAALGEKSKAPHDTRGPIDPFQF